MNGELKELHKYYKFGRQSTDIFRICEYDRSAFMVLNMAIYFSIKNNGDDFGLSDKEFGDELMVSDRTIQRIKKFLKDKGFLEVTIQKKGYGNISHYKLKAGNILNAIKNLEGQTNDR